jgi:beta-glucosidase
VFLGPLLDGEYPADVIADTAEVTDWSFVKPGDTDLIRQPISLLGVNYYSTVTVQMWDGESPRANADGHKDMGGTPWPGSEDVEFLVQPGPYTAMGWNIDPSGLEDLLVALHQAYPTLPLMVTENGAAFDDVVTEEADGPAVHDVDRTDYLRRHFTAAHRAMGRGVDLRGYQVWSLMDNFEWGYGYSKRFGIVRVDYDTLERLPKDSAKWYAELIRTRAIPA